MLGIAEGYPNFANIVLKVFTVRKTRIQTENISFLSELYDTWRRYTVISPIYVHTFANNDKDFSQLAGFGIPIADKLILCSDVNVSVSVRLRLRILKYWLGLRGGGGDTPQNIPSKFC